MVTAPMNNPQSLYCNQVEVGFNKPSRIKIPGYNKKNEEEKGQILENMENLDDARWENKDSLDGMVTLEQPGENQNENQLMAQAT